MKRPLSLLVNIYELPLIEYLKPFVTSVHALARNPETFIISNDELDDARMKMEIILKRREGDSILDRFLAYGLQKSTVSDYEEALVNGINIRLPLPPNSRLTMMSLANKTKEIYFVHMLLSSIKNELKRVEKRGAEESRLYERAENTKERIERRAPQGIKESLLRAFDRNIVKPLKEFKATTKGGSGIELGEKLREGAIRLVREISSYCVLIVKDILNHFSYAFVRAIDDDTFFVYSFGSVYIISFGRYLEEYLGIRHTMSVNMSIEIDGEDERDVLLAIKYILLAFVLIDGASDAGVLSSYTITRVIETLDPFMADEFATYVSKILANVSGTVEGVRVERVRDLEGIFVNRGIKIIKIGGYIHNGILILKRIGAYEIIELLNVIDAVREQILLISNSVSSSLHTLLSVHSEVQEIVKEAKEEYREAKPLLFLSALSAIVLAADGLLSLYRDLLFYYALHRLGILLAGARLGYFFMKAFYDTYIDVLFEPSYDLTGDSMISYERGGKYAERIYKREVKSTKDKVYGILGAIVFTLITIAISLSAKFSVYRPNEIVYILTIMLSGTVGFVLIGKAFVWYATEISYPEGKIQVKRRGSIEDKRVRRAMEILLYLAVVYLILYSASFIANVIGA